MFARLKCRHSAATALRAWRHAAQFNHFEARYTRRELIAALSEQKGHIRRLEKCVDDHYIVRGELEHVVKDAHERAARLVVGGCFLECNGWHHLPWYDHYCEK